MPPRNRGRRFDPNPVLGETDQSIIKGIVGDNQNALVFDKKSGKLSKRIPLAVAMERLGQDSGAAVEPQPQPQPQPEPQPELEEDASFADDAAEEDPTPEDEGGE